MKKFVVTLLAAGFVAAPALADDFEAYCVEFNESNGIDTSGCSCLAEAADADVTAELLAITPETDLESLSAESQEAIASCWPDAA